MDSAVAEERYTRTPRLSKRVRVALGVLGVAVLTGVVSTVAWGFANPPITATAVWYHVDSDTSVSVRVEVHKDPAKAATCTLQARDPDGNVVGTLDVPVPANTEGAKVSTLRETLKTTNRATVGEVLQCTLAR